MTRFVLHPVLVGLLCLACSLAGELRTIAAAASPTGSKWSPARIDSKYLPNAYRLHEKVISGGQPAGESAFRELSALGVKTVVSVDGAQPEVQLAGKYGFRYVHLPHGYDGIDQHRARQLAKAVRDLPGPIYIHCHHGKHRSPAAAAVACVGAGLLKPDRALNVLNTAGTSANYRGLYQAARDAQAFDNALLSALEANFPETAKLPPMAESMVAIEHTQDRLLSIKKAGWRAPARHPDLDPAHEALLLREHFTELLRTEAAQHKSKAFRQMLLDSETSAGQLESSLRLWSDRLQPIPEQIEHSFRRITHNCQACHRQFRDVPQVESP